MNKFYSKILYALIIGIIFMQTPAFSGEWEQVVLRNTTQKGAGLKGGEGMQMVQCVAYAPSNPQILYLVSDTSQVWKSADAGKTWKMKHKGFYANGGFSIGVDPLNENIVFVAGSIGYPVDRYQPTNPLCGIFKTTDGGDNWEIVKQTLYFKREDGDDGGTYFVFIPDKNNTTQTKTIFAATYSDGLFKSTDTGQAWSYCGLKGVNIYDLKLNPVDPKIIFIASTQGFYKYNDVSKEAVKIGLSLPDYPRTIAVNPKNPGIIYAAVGKYGVFCSVNGGNTFIEKNKGLPRGEEYTHISISPANPEYLYVSINKNRTHRPNPFYSHDAGNTWQSPKTIDRGNLAFFSGEQRYFSAKIEPHPNDQNIAISAANGKGRVLKTDDAGANWFYSSEGYSGARMGLGKASAAFYKTARKFIFFLIDFGPALTEDAGSTFKMLPVEKTYGHFTSNAVGAVAETDNTAIIAAAVGRWDKQMLEVSRNNGKSWKIIENSEDNYKFIAAHPQNPNIIYAQGLISEDGAKSWRRLTKKIYGIFRGNGNVVYSVEKGPDNKAVIIRSDNRGKTWKAPYPQLPIPVNGINELEISPKDHDLIYVATNFGIGIYNKKAGNWIKRGEENGLTKDYFGMTAVKCIAADPRHPEIVYAGRWAPGKGQSNGVFMSRDYGLTWENITGNLQEPFTVWSVSVSPHDGYVYIGSSHGTWKKAPPY